MLYLCCGMGYTVLNLIQTMYLYIYIWIIYKYILMYYINNGNILGAPWEIQTSPFTVPVVFYICVLVLVPFSFSSDDL